MIYYMKNPFKAEPRILLGYNIIHNILLVYHNSIHNAHSITNFKTDICSKFWFEGMNNKMDTVVRNCTPCTLLRKQRKRQALQTIKIREFNELLMLDHKGPLPTTIQGYKYCVVMIDVYSGYTRIIPVEDAGHEYVIECLIYDWFNIFGVPKKIHSDGGGAFKHETFKLFAKNLNISLTMGHPYMHSSQGKVERVNREINRSLKIYSVVHTHDYINDKQIPNDWAFMLQFLGLKLNNSINVHGLAPNEIVLGKTFNNDIDTMLKLDLLNIDYEELAHCNNVYWYVGLLKNIRYFKNKIFQEKLDMYQEHMERNWIKQVKWKEYDIKEGTTVMINNDPRYSDGISNKAKLQINNKPHYVVMDIYGNNCTIKNILDGEYVHNVHLQRLIPYQNTQVYDDELVDVLRNKQTWELDNKSTYELEKIFHNYNKNLTNNDYLNILQKTGDENEVKYDDRPCYFENNERIIDETTQIQWNPRSMTRTRMNARNLRTELETFNQNLLDDMSNNYDNDEEVTPITNETIDRQIRNLFGWNDEDNEQDTNNKNIDDDKKQSRYNLRDRNKLKQKQKHLYLKRNNLL